MLFLGSTLHIQLLSSTSITTHNLFTFSVLVVFILRNISHINYLHATKYFITISKSKPEINKAGTRAPSSGYCYFSFLSLKLFVWLFSWSDFSWWIIIALSLVLHSEVIAAISELLYVCVNSNCIDEPADIIVCFQDLSWI